MLRIFCLSVLVVATTSVWSQVEPSASGGALNEDHMMTPPPVSNGVYATSIGVESRSNYLTGGLVITGSYNDNILDGNPTQKTPDSTYSIVPMIALDRTTPRQVMSLSYSSGVTLYQNETELNGISQGGTAGYDFHITPYATVGVSDTFGQNNNLFNQANPFSSSGVSTGGPSPTSVYVFPFENQYENSTSGRFQYQYARNAMIGGGGTYSIQRFSNPSNTPSLDNTNIGGLSGFWSRRITPGQYLGIIDQYSRITTHPTQSDTDTNAVDIFYTKYLTRTVSVSILGGPQYYVARDPVSGASNAAWTPEIQTSAGYLKGHTNLSADYARTVTGAGGLVGAYHANTADVAAQQQISRKMTIGARGSYALFRNVTPVVSSNNPGGHTITGAGYIQRSFRERLSAQIGYSRFHQSYNNFESGASGAQLYPDSNRVYGSVSYSFYRPLGR